MYPSSAFLRLPVLILFLLGLPTNANARPTKEPKPTILCLTDRQSQVKALVAALEHQNMHVEVATPKEVCAKRLQLVDYDAVILNDIPAKKLCRKATANLVQYVNTCGGALLVTTGQNGLVGQKSCTDPDLAQLLPVRMSASGNHGTRLALVVALDSSGSMTGRRLRLSKQAVDVVVNALGPDAKVGIVAFHGRARRVRQLEPLTSRHRAAIHDALQGVRGQGGTNIDWALRLSFAELVSAEARLKHVLLLSDGRSNVGGIPDLLSRMGNAGVTVSTVAIGEEADQKLLRRIAREGSGFYYSAKDPSSLPRLCLKDICRFNEPREMSQPVRVALGRSAKASQLFKEIDLRSAPHLRGHIQTQPKERAEVLLATHRNQTPLLVRWRRGCGKVTVWASGLTSLWAGDWPRWQHYGVFWSQVVKDMLRPGGVAGCRKQYHESLMTRDLIWPADEDWTTMGRPCPADTADCSKVVAITSVPPGARITINGDPIFGATPTTLIFRDQQHPLTVRLEKSNYHPHIAQLTFDRLPAELSVLLIPLSATESEAFKKAKKLYRAGWNALVNNEVKKAKDYFRECVKTYPLYANAYRQLGIICSIEGKPQEAIRHYLTYLRMTKTAPDRRLVCEAVRRLGGKCPEPKSSPVLPHLRVVASIVIESRWTARVLMLGMVSPFMGSTVAAVVWTLLAVRHAH